MDRVSTSFSISLFYSLALDAHGRPSLSRLLLFALPISHSETREVRERRQENQSRLD